MIEKKRICFFYIFLYPTKRRRRTTKNSSFFLIFPLVLFLSRPALFALSLSRPAPPLELHIFIARRLVVVERKRFCFFKFSLSNQATTAAANEKEKKLVLFLASCAISFSSPRCPQRTTFLSPRGDRVASADVALLETEQKAIKRGV